MDAEARILGRYLLGCDVEEEHVARYAYAASLQPHESDETELRIVAYALAHPRTLGPLDGALALTRPRALLRRKLLLMAAILEASPRYCDWFLPVRRAPSYAVVAAAAALRAAVQTGLGLILLRFVA